ncbi:hypothetical protein [Archangium sp. Cb G35]|uniref:hypothetical protein n=1 Tax=Archangium sp. Cb G35 TaxID=1920190 RepID=UPI000B32E0C6|nr:hypothetical protein [Archangium sp. Cb G35]
MAPFKYRVKDEYKALFTNLGKGEALDVPDAFAEVGKPIRKDATALVNVRNEKLLEKLVDDGFVEKLDLDLEPVLKP